MGLAWKRCLVFNGTAGSPFPYCWFTGTVNGISRANWPPTVVLNLPFDTAERREFSRRLTTGLPIEDARLKGASLTADSGVWHFSSLVWTCRLLPAYGVFLVVTDEQRREVVFGFFQYATKIKDIRTGRGRDGSRWCLVLPKFCEQPRPSSPTIGEKICRSRLPRR